MLSGFLPLKFALVSPDFGVAFCGENFLHHFIGGEFERFLF